MSVHSLEQFVFPAGFMPNQVSFGEVPTCVSEQPGFEPEVVLDPHGLAAVIRGLCNDTKQPPSAFLVAGHPVHDAARLILHGSL